jgi:sortase A
VPSSSQTAQGTGNEILLGEVSPRIRAKRKRTGFILRTAGTLCLVAALGVGGYMAWLLWGTGITTSRAQTELKARILERIETPRPPVVPEDPVAPVSVSFSPGEPMAILRIPRIGLDMVVVEGSDTENLKKGPGHYPDTAYPWEESGRVAIAGHRTTYGQPFWSLDELRRGDLIRVVTEFGRFDYRVTRLREVLPTDGWVLEQTDRPTLVLTTCTPRFTASRRLIVFAERLAA